MPDDLPTRARHQRDRGLAARAQQIDELGLGVAREGGAQQVADGGEVFWLLRTDLDGCARHG